MGIRAANGANASPIMEHTPLLARTPNSSSCYSTQGSRPESPEKAHGVDPEEALAKPRGSWVRLIRLARDEYGMLGGAVGLLVVSSSVTMAVPLAMGKIVDIVANKAAAPWGLTIGQMFAALGATFVVGALANTGRIILIRTAGERLVARIRSQLFARVIQMDMAFFDRNRTGDLVSRLSNDTQVVSKSITNNVSDGLRSVISAAVGVGMMVYVSPKLTCVMLGIVPPVALWAVLYGRYIKRLSRKTQEAVGDLTKVAEERIAGVRTVQMFSREQQEARRFDREVARILRLAQQEAVANGLYFGGNGLVGNLALLAFLGLGGRMVLRGELSIGDMTSVLLYSAYAGASLAGLSSFYSEMMKGVGAGARLFYLMDRAAAVDPNPQGAVLEAFSGAVELERVGFSYPTRPGTVFRDLSLTVPAGAHVAIAGPSGKGKSTLAALLLRFYDPDEGRVLVDGHDLRGLSLAAWRAHLAVVPQDPVLFAGTIRDNLLFGRPAATDAELVDALTRADAWGFVERFPAALDTYVGERGVSLSGGQRQRVAIARALLARPRVLILDEATSALDGTREARVLAGLGDLPCTVITVAHRASTLMKSDLIYVLGESGCVVESGTYHELMGRENGYFRRLMAAHAGSA
ncbi:ATP-binding cassette permease mdl1 [Coemansia sp. RSA 1358]|nr:ATP-binding cassette permease mdl1 [Coemansia sp. RSA 1358]